LRPRPEKDELFSCWLVRLAWNNGEKLHPFCVRRLGVRWNVWGHDVDRLAPLDIIERAAIKTGIDIERVFSTTLAAFEGKIYERHVTKGVAQWIMPIGRYSRTRTLHGQQFCPWCLREDVVPYFRKSWRLAFVVTCERHGIVLSDDCPRCRAPISYHEGDFGKDFLRDFCPLTLCPRCGWDLRIEISPAPIAESEIQKFQRKLSDAIGSRWIEVNAGRAIYCMSFFGGLHALVRILSSNAYTKPIRDYLLARDGFLPLPSGFPKKTNRFEDLRVGDRYVVMRLLGQILSTWPRRLLRSVSRSASIQFLFA